MCRLSVLLQLSPGVHQVTEQFLIRLSKLGNLCLEGGIFLLVLFGISFVVLIFDLILLIFVLDFFEIAFNCLQFLIQIKHLFLE